MPLSSLTLSSTFSPTLFKTLNYFGNPSLQANALAFNLTGINLATWNQSYENVVTLFTSAPAGLTATVAAGGSLTASTTYYYEVTAVGYASNSTTNETTGSASANAATT